MKCPNGVKTYRSDDAERTSDEPPAGPEGEDYRDVVESLRFPFTPASAIAFDNFSYHDQFPHRPLPLALGCGVLYNL